MLGRLRVLLILGLVVSPVTADLRHGFLWSEASAEKTYSPFVLPLLNWFYPQCTFGYYKSYDASGKFGSVSWADKYGCRTQCVRHDWCISEEAWWPGDDWFTPTKITYGCVQTICITPCRSSSCRPWSW
jgi:hypothetical protein